MMRWKNECIVNCDVNDDGLEYHDGDRIISEIIRMVMMMHFDMMIVMAMALPQW